MKSQLSIKVTIAGRIYPLSIEADEEESVRKAAKMLNERINEYRKNYNIRDMQDLLVMAALPFAQQTVELEKISLNGEKSVTEKLQRIDKLISEELA